MNILERSFNLLPWIVATAFIAGIVHVVSVLMMPAVAPQDALARLAQAANVTAPTQAGVTLLGGDAGAVPLPFEDPAMAEGVCLFDLSKGLLHVRAAVDGEDFIGLSFHSGAGRIFHAMTDHSAIKGKIDIVVGDAEQIGALETEDADAAPVEEVRLTAPTRRGFVLIRSLAKRDSDRPRALERVRAVSCETFQPARE